MFTGLRALWSNRFAASPGGILPVLLAVLGVLTLLYRFALPAVTAATLTAALGVRVLVAGLALVRLLAIPRIALVDLRDEDASVPSDADAAILRRSREAHSAP